MYYILLEICIGGHFLEDCFCCYSQQIKSALANDFQQITLLLLVFVRLQTLVLFFLCFSAFYKNTFVLTFIMKYFTTFQ